jgi:hypothetical protein
MAYVEDERLRQLEIMEAAANRIANDPEGARALKELSHRYAGDLVDPRDRERRAVLERLDRLEGTSKAGRVEAARQRQADRGRDPAALDEEIRNMDPDAWYEVAAERQNAYDNRFDWRRRWNLSEADIEDIADPSGGEGFLSRRIRGW